MKATNDWIYDLKEHERQQLLRDSRAPFLEKLRWLEQAHHIMIEMKNQQQNSKRMTGTTTIE